MYDRPLLLLLNCINHSLMFLTQSLRSDDGKSFFIKNIQTLESNILSQYFKHSNFSSFVRQLNFYGFTKAKDLKVVEANDAKYWQFHHLHFQRENPELLVKIVRRLANSTSTSNHATGLSSLGKKLDGAESASEEDDTETETDNDDKGNKKKNKTKWKKNPDAKERRETDIVKKEIQELKGKLHSMEDEMKKLTNIMSSVNMTNDNDDGDNGHGADDNVSKEVHTDLNGTDMSMCTENGSGKEGGNENEGSVFPIAAKCQMTPSSKRIAGANKKPRILLNDSHLFGSGSSTSNPIDTTTATSSAANANQSSKRSKSLHNVSPKTLIPMAIAITVTEHAASLDLPDLGLASNDADLFLDGTDQASAPSKILSRSNSSRRGSITGVIVNEMLQVHTTGDDMEVDDIISSLESDAASVRVPVPCTTQDQQSNGIMTDAAELLPGLLSDEEEFDKLRNHESDDETAEVHYLDVDVKMKKDPEEEDLLDQNHLLNLETCLATLPLADRIVFVQDVMNNIRGMDDLLKQGLTVVAKSDSAPSTFTLTTGGARLMVDRYLSELDPLLSRVGLSIELDIQQKQSSLKTSSTCCHGASCARRSSAKSTKKNSSFLEIEA